ncbi:hypothetical protein A2U01_0053136, partial [Trifolium medium]|nr:hypothetical protein [Trifolium medium]
ISTTFFIFGRLAGVLSVQSNATFRAASISFLQPKETVLSLASSICSGVSPLTGAL